MRQAARQLLDLRGEGQGRASDESGFLRAVLAAWPDRVARRRQPGSDRLLLASGQGARQARESGVRDEFLVAVDVDGGAAQGALVRLASGVDREWLEADRVETTHAFDAGAGAVRATRREMRGAVVLAERVVAADPTAAEPLLVAALEERGLGEENVVTQRRVAFAGLAVDVANLLRCACAGRTTLPDGVDLLAALPHAVRRDLDRLAPATLEVPSGRRVTLEYRDDGSVVASVKLQELFGLADGPRLGPARRSVVFALLAPNGRPVQMTADLASFWRTTYPEVRKELRGRYPRHPWPEDPWTAPPTARTKKSRG